MMRVYRMKAQGIDVIIDVLVMADDELEAAYRLDHVRDAVANMADVARSYYTIIVSRDAVALVPSRLIDWDKVDGICPISLAREAVASRTGCVD
jgi:hypothetical protein